MSFADWFVARCNEKGVSPTAVASAVGVSPASASYWVSGRNIPKKTTLAKIEEYFGSEFRKENATTVAGDGVSEKDLALLNWFRSLPEEKRKAILIAQDAPKELL